MSEALSHVPVRRPSNLHLVRDIIEEDERPEDTVVQERDQVGEVLVPTFRNPDAQTLQREFSGFELEANELSDLYRVTGKKLTEGGRSVYKLEITGDAEHNFGNYTTLTIGVAQDGSPDWQFADAELDSDFERKLVHLLEDTIADARYA